MTTFRETLALAELGRERVLSVEDWVKIRRLRRAEGMPIAEIARVMGISWNTVKAALASGHPSGYVRRPQGSVADAFEPRIRELLRAYPSMPSTVIAERIGWPYSVRTLSGEGGALAPGVPAAVPRVVDRVCGRGDRAVLTEQMHSSHIVDQHVRKMPQRNISNINNAR